MFKAKYIRHKLNFILPAGTSRGVLHSKDSWFIILSDENDPEEFGIGECSLIPGLSVDDPEAMNEHLHSLCTLINTDTFPEDHSLRDFPSIEFGLETAIMDITAGGKRLLFSSPFTEGVQGLPINGLIWMGSPGDMLQQIHTKTEQGFKILKLKVGAIDFDEELNILRQIRKDYSADELEIRLDANGAWDSEEVLEKLERLSEFHIHSLEQPLAAGQHEVMASVCAGSPIDIALDEELIGVSLQHEREQLLETIKPQYIILKPSLLGGFAAAEKWIEAAESLGTGWWATSALESNIGLNAIAQWTATKETALPQGLGTGSLYSNNIPSPLRVKNDKIYYCPDKQWDLSELRQIWK